MDPFDFEKRVGLVYEKLGYKVEQRGGQSDNGIDVILRRGGKSFAVQVKRYSQRNLVCEPALRDFYGSFVGEFDAGVFVTTSDFTYQAKAWVKGKRIELLNWERWLDHEKWAARIS